MVCTELPPIPDLKAWFTYTSWNQISKYPCYKFELHPDGQVVLFNRRIMSGRRKLLFRKVLV
jgi:hypothetical protein